MEEIWKDIKNYEKLYKISNYGRLFSYKSNKILRYSVRPNGYLKYSLYKNGRYEHISMHRLVAQAFIPNPNNYQIVNHIDENKTNNQVDNLEWCTSKYNVNYGTGIKKRSKTQKLTMTTMKPVIIIYPSGLMRYCNSLHETSKISGKSLSVVSNIAGGKNITGQSRDGYKFKYYSLELKSK